MKLTTAHLTAPKRGEALNGDAVWVRQYDEEKYTIAVVDALGHGPEAAAVAKLVVGSLEEASPEDTVLQLVERTHKTLAGTRGAAALFVRLRGAHLEACGVGNVELRADGTKVPVVLSPGVLGARIHRLRSFGAELAAGTRLALFSDGVSSRFSLADLRHLPPREACERTFASYRHHHDDATLLIGDVGQS